MSQSIRWGIMSTGFIAHQFVKGLAVVPDAELLAVGSRTQESADKFADEFDIPRRYSSYEALVNDPDIDAIYIGTPHPFHYENSVLCLNAGKAILCEKPFTINAKETAALIKLAQEKQIFLMEAMWTRFLPAIHKVRDLLAEGNIGEVRMIQADFGFRTGFNEEGRLFDLAMGGGALLDVGIYPISLASMILGTPERIVSLADLGKSGVDEQASAIFGYADGQIATISTAIRTNTRQSATIYGTEGMLHIHSEWWHSDRLTLSRNGRDNVEFHLPLEGNGYNYEAIEVMNCLRAGKLESDMMPLDETLSIMETMDTIRDQWGLKYPME